GSERAPPSLRRAPRAAAEPTTRSRRSTARASRHSARTSPRLRAASRPARARTACDKQFLISRCPFRQEAFVKGDDRIDVLRDVEAWHDRCARIASEPCAQVGAAEQARQRTAERCRIAGRDEKTGPAVLDDFGYAGDARRYD